MIFPKLFFDISIICGQILFNSSAKLFSEIGSPLICILSVILCIEGEINNPTFKPDPFNTLAIIAHVLPFPLVPAICIDFNVVWGLFEYLSSLVILSRFNLGCLPKLFVFSKFARDINFFIDFSYAIFICVLLFI